MSETTPRRWVVAGGGTGGHVTPGAGAGRANRRPRRRGAAARRPARARSPPRARGRLRAGDPARAAADGPASRARLRAAPAMVAACAARGASWAERAPTSWSPWAATPRCPRWSRRWRGASRSPWSSPTPCPGAPTARPRASPGASSWSSTPRPGLRALGGPRARAHARHPAAHARSSRPSAGSAAAARARSALPAARLRRQPGRAPDQRRDARGSAFARRATPRGLPPDRRGRPRARRGGLRRSRPAGRGRRLRARHARAATAGPTSRSAARARSRWPSSRWPGCPRCSCPTPTPPTTTSPRTPGPWPMPLPRGCSRPAAAGTRRGDAIAAPVAHPAELHAMSAARASSRGPTRRSASCRSAPPSSPAPRREPDAPPHPTRPLRRHRRHRHVRHRRGAANQGYRVTGSDLRAAPTVERLRGLGIDVQVGHDADHLGDADVVVYSSARAADNPELVEAERRKIPVIPRAEMLAELMRLKDGIAVAGSHGKTTTTSLIAHVLGAAGLDPTAVIGGRVLASALAEHRAPRHRRAAGRRGRRERRLVPAAHAGDRGRHQHRPRAPRPLRHLRRAARRRSSTFANRVPFYGLAVLCLDHPGVQAILPRLTRRIDDLRLRARRPTCAASDVEARRLRHALRRAPPRRAARRGRAAAAGPPQRAQRARRARGRARARGPVRDRRGGARELPRRRAPLRAQGRGRRRHASSTTTATTRPRSAPRSPPRARSHSAAAHRRRVPAAPLHAHARPLRRLHRRLQRRRPAVDDGDLRRRRGEDPRRRRRRTLAEAIRAHGHRDVRFVADLDAVPAQLGRAAGPATSSSRSAPATSRRSGRDCSRRWRRPP